MISEQTKREPVIRVWRTKLKLFPFPFVPKPKCAVEVLTQSCCDPGSALRGVYRKEILYGMFILY